MEIFRPKARIRYRSFIWPIFVPTVLVALFGFVFLHSMQARIQNSREFTGELRTGTPPITISIPPHTNIETFQVSVGDHVAKGKTLAVINQGRLEHSIKDIEQKLLITQFQRECILNVRAATQLPQWAQDQHVEISTQLRIAAQTCLNDLDKLRLGIIDAEKKLRVLEKRRTLLNQRVNLILKLKDQGKESVESQTALSAVETLIARNALSEEIAQISAQVRLGKLDERSGIISQANALTETITQLRNDLDQMRVLSKSPRILAPASGRITRLRLPKIKNDLSHSIVVVEMEQDLERTFKVRVQVPWSFAKTLHNDTTLEFTALGLAKPDEVFIGRVVTDVVSMSETVDGDPWVWVQVVPTEQSSERLRKLYKRTAWAGPNSASILRVNKAPVSLLSALLQSWDAAMPKLKVLEQQI